MTESSTRILKLVVLAILLCAIVVAAILLLRDPEGVRREVQSWVHHHRLLAPAIYIAIYIVIGLLALPLWWLQMIAGYTFGLFTGVLFSQMAATIAAPLTLLLSRWLAADWFHRKVEAKMEKLRNLDDKLGHNGFLVVMAVRLTHVMPFGLSNYAMGLTRITPIDVCIGTMLGGIPTVALYVILGCNPKLLENWRYVVGLAVLNVALIVPVAMRYLRPQWFKRLGLE